MKLEDKKIVVTGGGGFLGGYVVRALKKRGVKHIFVPRSKDYDLRERDICRKVIGDAQIVIHLAAQIGGIGFIGEHAGEVFYNNLILGVELMEAARLAGVEKFVSIGTVCEYPKSPQIPFKEESLWDGYPEETTAPYGWAKKILIVQGEAYRKQYGSCAIHLLPVNLYGPRDNFSRELSHVIPALIKKVIEANEKKSPFVTVWGSGNATREFLYVEDAAEGIVLATENYDGVEPVNLGTGIETTIREVANLIMKLVGYRGKIQWDATKPDGQLRRRLDISRAEREFGFVARTTLREGLEKTVEWYQQHRI